MRNYLNTDFALLDRYDIFYGDLKSDAGVGSGRRRRFLDLYGFRFSITLWNVFAIELRDSFVFSVVQTVMEFQRIGCGYVRLGYLRLEVQSVRFVSCIQRRRMRTYQNTALAVLHRYGTLYGGYKSNAGVGSGRRRRFLDLYGFRFSTTLWNVFVIVSAIRCVFGSTACNRFWKNWVTLG
jgi:hypothetical protein